LLHSYIGQPDLPSVAVQSWSSPTMDREAVSPLCMGLSVGAGISMTFAAIVVAYPEHKAKDQGYERGKCGKVASIVLNLLFTNLGVILGILAVGYGPISVVTPMTSGANLLSNLILQPYLGLSTYTQDAVIGTLVLVSSVTMLIEVGPSDLPEDADVLELLLQPYAIAFVATALSLMIFSFCSIALKWTTDNMALTFHYSIVGGTVIVLNTAVTKVVQMKIPIAVMIPLVLAYVIFAIIGLMNGAQANGALEDASLFVPISAGVNLVLTCIAGLMIWGDGSRLPVPLSYGIIYLLVLIGTVLLCNADLLMITQELVKEAHIKGRYEESLAPGAARGTLQRSKAMQLDRIKFKERVKNSLEEHEDALDKILNMWEESLMKYSQTPGLWHSAKFQNWVNEEYELELTGRPDLKLLGTPAAGVETPKAASQGYEPILEAN